jgi:hypothetical protein
MKQKCERSGKRATVIVLGLVALVLAVTFFDAGVTPTPDWFYLLLKEKAEADFHFFWGAARD